MNIAEVIKGIDLTIEGLSTIKDALVAEEVCDTPEKETPKTKGAKKSTPVVEEVVEETPNEVMTDLEGAKCQFDVEQLKSMKYNEFKKFAASLGVKCTGTRDEIMERILALDVTITGGEVTVENEEPEAVEEEVVEEKPSKSDKPARSKKLGAKKADEPTRDEFDEQAEEIAESTSVEDIIEALADVEIKATKKNAVQKLAEALREGLITLDDEDEEEEEEVADEAPEADEEDGEEISADSYFPEYDPKGYNDPENMTEERAEAIEAKMDEVLTAYSEGELTDDEIASYVEDNATEEEIDLLGDEYTNEDILKLFMELIKRTIDNDGEEHEQGEPYEVADKDVCCGRELKYSKKTKQYICEHCGTEYEAE